MYAFELAFFSSHLPFGFGSKAHCKLSSNVTTGDVRELRNLKNTHSLA